MSKVGLVLGGGGITGAAFQFGTLLALEMATGWDPNAAEVVVGTSAGAFSAAMVRGNALHLDSLTGTGETRDEIQAFLDSYLYRRAPLNGGLRWARRGLVPALRNPSMHLVAGSPGRYTTEGIEDWIRDTAGPLAESWPSKPTAIVSFDIETKERIPFGTEAAPQVSLAKAVAASSAVPFIYQPVQIGDRWYADGGLASGTSADLVLAHPEPLDLILVVAPLAATEPRRKGRFYEDVLDRAGRTALAAELSRIREEWPEVDVLVLRPDEEVLDLARPNPMSAKAAVPTFLATMRSMRNELAHRSVWRTLSEHIGSSARP